MKTISAKELRNNLDLVVARARAGESIRVTYRSKPAFTINPEPANQPTFVPGSRAALQQFIKIAQEIRTQAKRTDIKLPDKSYEEIYYDDIAKKYDLG